MTEGSEEDSAQRNIIEDDQWQEVEDTEQTSITCEVAYDVIVSAMVNYDPRDRYNIFARDRGTGNLLNINPDMSLKISRGPRLPKYIERHTSECNFCKRLIERLSGLKLSRGQLAIESNLSQKSTAFTSNPKLKRMMLESGWRPQRDKFKGTPTSIVEGMVRDASQFIKQSDRDEFMDRKTKFIKHVLNITGHKQKKEPDGSVSITDTEFIQVMAAKGAIAVIADPWFLLAPRPPNIRQLSGEK